MSRFSGIKPTQKRTFFKMGVSLGEGGGGFSDIFIHTYAWVNFFFFLGGGGVLKF